MTDLSAYEAELSDTESRANLFNGVTLLGAGYELILSALDDDRPQDIRHVATVSRELAINILTALTVKDGG